MTRMKRLLATIVLFATLICVTPGDAIAITTEKNILLGNHG